MTFMPRFVLGDLEAPQPVGERYGLLAVAAGPVLMPSKAQGGGITYYPTSCGFTREYPIECGPDDSPGDSPGDSIKIFDPGTAFTEGDPFELYSSIQCGSAGLGALSDDAVATIRRRLDLRFANGLAAGIENGAAYALSVAGGPELVPTDPTRIESVISALEGWLYNIRPVASTGGPVDGQGYGYRGYIHAPASVAAYAMREHLIEPDPDNRRIWKTAMGSIWVFGAYSGALPGAGAAVDGVDGIYITGQTTVWEGPDVITPDLKQTFDRETNQWMALKERAYMLTFDCAVGAAPFDYAGSSL